MGGGGKLSLMYTHVHAQFAKLCKTQFTKHYYLRRQNLKKEIKSYSIHVSFASLKYEALYWLTW